MVILLADLMHHLHTFHRQPNINWRVLVLLVLSVCLIFSNLGLALPEKLRHHLFLMFHFTFLPLFLLLIFLMINLCQREYLHVSVFWTYLLS